MTDFDKKWMIYLCIVLGITFLAGRAAYWTLTFIFSETVVNADGETVTEVGSAIDIIRKLVTPVLMGIGIMATSASYMKHRDEDTQ